MRDSTIKMLGTCLDVASKNDDFSASKTLMWPSTRFFSIQGMLEPVGTYRFCMEKHWKVRLPPELPSTAGGSKSSFKLCKTCGNVHRNPPFLHGEFVPQWNSWDCWPSFWMFCGVRFIGKKKWSENNDPPMENVVAHSTLPFPGSSPAISQVGARTGDMLWCFKRTQKKKKRHKKMWLNHAKSTSKRVGTHQTSKFFLVKNGFHVCVAHTHHGFNGWFSNHHMWDSDQIPSASESPATGRCQGFCWWNRIFHWLNHVASHFFDEQKPCSCHSTVASVFSSISAHSSSWTWLFGCGNGAYRHSVILD